ncbi:hypothetical protein C6V83_01345 [Gordonia iterans]|uniref:Integral membrane bound transporter domain-containing protein n=1 Tax=Gordonia iterans TaxID=1004901 RepID=A0A2S0KBU9_9ACTN|nr:FUSC family protein [Gordonia iterans]AVL99139.1 hypothetical protein C6V83_01345 [Gordonia iterans]
MQLHTPYWRRLLVATDPGRVRVTTATATAISVLVTSLVAWSLVVFAEADHGVLAMGVIMTLQAALNVKDPTARGRLLTTVLLVPPAFAALTAAVLLSSRRPVEIVVFIALTGVVTYLRGFGPRATAIGTVTFFAYFFALLLQPKADELPLLFLVTGCAVTCMLVIRLFGIWGRPRHQLALLLTELRGAGSTALTEAVNAPPATALTQASRVQRVDQVARTIDDWQTRYSTARYVRCDAQTFARLVLDARIDMDHACRKIAEFRAGGDRVESGRLTAPAVTDLSAVLSSATSPADVREAAERAHTRLTSPGADTPDEVTAGAADRATLAFARLRDLDLHHGLDATATSAEIRRRHPEPQRRTAPSPAASSRWKPWLRWRVTTRMAVQVVIAASLASVVGYSISASRWYWAVLTAFLVFAGTTTRGAILTRATRRITGTVAGVIVGLALVVLVDGNIPALIVICVLAVFFALYLGPLQYTVMSLFITILLAGLYGLLGVLNRHILELRLIETLAGAALGVVCAYLIFSTSSHPALTARIDAYFDTLDRLLNAVRRTLAGHAGTGELVASIRSMDAAQADLHTTVDGMSLSLAVGHRAETAHLLRLLDLNSHIATRLGQSTMAFSSGTGDASTSSGSGSGSGDDLAPRFDHALAHVLASSATARAALVDGHTSSVDPDETAVIDCFGRLPGDPLSPQYEVVRTLSRLNWILLRSVQVRAS